MKLAMTAATLLLVAGGAVACGGDDGDSGSGDGGSAASGGSDGTSVEQFCTAFSDFSNSLAGADSTDVTAVVKLLKDEADKLDEAGTPEDIPEDAEEGLDLVLSAIDDLPDDATLEDVSKLEDSFSEEDKAKADSFDTYLADTCPDLSGGGEASEVPTPATSDGVTPSEDSTEAPSDDAS